MNKLPPLKPNDPTLKLTRFAGPKLQKAFKDYIIGRDQKAVFDKDVATENIFNAAKEAFGDALIYAERVAANVFLSIKDRDDVVRVYEVILQPQYADKYSDFWVLHETSIFDKNEHD